MDFTENKLVLDKFKSYPDFIQQQMCALRDLVIQTAAETVGLTKLEETLKWGEPGFLTQHGSTIRMDWKAKNPNEYAMYFHCQTKLVDTFKELYQDRFQFEGNRTIVFQRDEKIAEKALKHCISLALNYHNVKHFPLLGT